MQLRELRRVALERFPKLTNWLLFFLRKKHPAFIEYPLKPIPRYGHGKPPHPQLNDLINQNRDGYKELLTEFLKYSDNYLKIPQEDNGGWDPCWINGFLPGLDGISLYGLLTMHKPKNYIEVGSGNSTRFAYRAIKDHNLNVKITSIDPFPRVGIDKLCNQVIREPLEKVDLTLFDSLESGDILFIDNSHYSFANSDATVVFLDIFPRLKSGVLVEIHDIYLPHDYTKSFAERWYQEQYLLACHLLAQDNKYEVVLPNYFISEDQELNKVLNPIWEKKEMKGVERHGGSFWLRIL